jgi:hypothetical protein
MPDGGGASDSMPQGPQGAGGGGSAGVEKDGQVGVDIILFQRYGVLSMIASGL